MWSSFFIDKKNQKSRLYQFFNVHKSFKRPENFVSSPLFNTIYFLKLLMPVITGQLNPQTPQLRNFAPPQRRNSPTHSTIILPL